MVTFTPCNCDAQYVLTVSMTRNSSSRGTTTVHAGPRTSVYANRGVPVCPRKGRHLSSPIIQSRFQNLKRLSRRNSNEKFAMNRAVKKQVYDHRVPVCSLEKLPAAVNMAQHCLHHLNTDILLAAINPAIDNIKDSPKVQDALLSIQSASDYSSVLHLYKSLTSALHHVEQLMSHVVPSLYHIGVSTLTTQQFVDQIGVSMASDYVNVAVEAMPEGKPSILATIATSTIVVSSVHERRRDLLEGRDQLPLHYDAELIAAYFKKRPMDTAMRSAKIVFECSNLTFNTFWDKYVGREREMERSRAKQLVELITRLGPTGVKIGQALSARPDMLSQAYLEELQKLQDRVPPFSNEEAKQTILKSLGIPAEEIFGEMSEHPITAASLGQQVSMVQSDMIGLLDSWAYRFFDELDYVHEPLSRIVHCFSFAQPCSL